MTSPSIPPRLTGIDIAVNPDGSVSHRIIIDRGERADRFAEPRGSQETSTSLSATLDGYLDLAPPDLLFHYTSPDGLIGILKNREIWASNISFLNDMKETSHAVDLTTHAIDHRLNQRDLNQSESSMLRELRKSAGSGVGRYYVASFTEERDLLSQWRAYCPPAGGFSLGISSDQLSAMAEAQSFLLVPCIYDHATQIKVASEFVEGCLNRFRTLSPTSHDENTLIKDLGNP